MTEAPGGIDTQPLSFGEKIDDFRFPEAFNKLSPEAQNLYRHHCEQGKRKNLPELTNGFKPLKEAAGLGGHSDLYVSEDGTKILKVDSPDSFGFKQPAEGPTILIMRELLVKAGLDPSILPQVFEFGVTDEGKRFIILEKVAGRRPLDYRTTESIEDPREFKPPTLDELVKIVNQSCLVFPVLEHHGFSPTYDRKTGDFFINEQGNVRIIDWDVPIASVQKLASEDRKDFFKKIACVFLALKMSESKPYAISENLRQVRQKSGDISFIAEVIGKDIPDKPSRDKAMAFINFLVGQPLSENYSYDTFRTVAKMIFGFN